MARTTTTKRTARKTTKATARKSRKPSILGLPIEGAGHETPRAELADYIDTEGMELPEPDEKLDPKQQAAKDAKFVARQKAKQEREAAKTYHGAPIPATKVFRRDMPEFKNCRAECWMLINGEASYTFANTYNGLLKSSYDAKHYTYPLNAKNLKKVNAKAEQMIEVEVTEWPTWITNAAITPTKRTRKSSK